MKNLVSMVCALSFCSAVFCGAETLDSLDLSKAFPNEQLFNQTNLGGMQSFMYLTNAGYPELKKQFVEFIGNGWKEENAEEYKRMLKQHGDTTKMAGIALFMHEDDPEKRLGLSLMKMPMAGKNGMLSVMVIDGKKK